MPIKIGINGMGRIGRMVVRSIYENHKDKIQIKHINNRSDSEVCANLLKYDSVHGKFNAEIKSNSSYLKINKDKISFSQFSNIQDINWKKYNVDYGLILCTLRHYTKEQSLETIKLVKEFSSKGVVGFDIAADEAGYSLDNHVDAFNYAIEN